MDAVVEAAVQRTRPVALTAAATVLAMVPLTRSVFWGPMAIAIMGGLTVATVLTIFFVPALYAAWFKVRRHEGTVPSRSALRHSLHVMTKLRTHVLEKQTLIRICKCG